MALRLFNLLHLLMPPPKDILQKQKHPANDSPVVKDDRMSLFYLQNEETV